MQNAQYKILDKLMLPLTQSLVDMLQKKNQLKNPCNTRLIINLRCLDQRCEQLLVTVRPFLTSKTTTIYYIIKDPGNNSKEKTFYQVKSGWGVFVHFEVEYNNWSRSLMNCATF